MSIAHGNNGTRCCRQRAAVGPCLRLARRLLPRGASGYGCDASAMPAMSEQDEPPRWLGGHLLISDFDLVDPNFHQAVVLMIDHDEEGAFGLVVNRPSPFTLGEVVEGMEDGPASRIPVYVGGPVQQDALFVLRDERAGAGEGTGHPVEGVAFEPASQTLMDYLRRRVVGAAPRRTARPSGSTRATRAGRRGSSRASWKPTPGWCCGPPASWSSPPTRSGRGSRRWRARARCTRSSCRRDSSRR